MDETEDRTKDPVEEGGAPGSSDGVSGEVSSLDETAVMSPLGEGDGAPKTGKHEPAAFGTSMPPVPGMPASSSGDGAVSPSAVAKVLSDDGKKRGIIIACAVVGALLAAYLAGFAYYSGHFLPKTVIGSYDISGMSADDAADFLDRGSADYALSVRGGGLDFEVTSADTGLKLDSHKVVARALDANAAWTWPAVITFGESQDLTGAMQATYDQNGFTAFVKGKVAEVNAAASEPVSAGIAYDKASGGFKVVPEQLGTKLDEDAVLEKVENAAFHMEHSVEVGEEDLLRPPLLSDDPRLGQAVDSADALLGADIKVTLAGMPLAHADIETIAGWIRLDQNVVPYVDEGVMRGWTGTLAADTNTVGTQREYDTPRGEHVVVEGGSYGWEVEYEPFVTAVLDAVAARKPATVEMPCSSTAAAVPNEKNVDFGARYIDVNLSTQHAVFYDGDAVLWESDIVSGIPDAKHSTPYGVYEINLKESPSKLIGEMVNDKPEYETTVAYWMPFVGNAIGFHDATWQPGFGGDLYASGYGSHGCVNLPYGSAEELYGIVTPGTPVITHA